MEKPRQRWAKLQIGAVPACPDVMVDNLLIVHHLPYRYPDTRVIRQFFDRMGLATE